MNNKLRHTIILESAVCSVVFAFNLIKAREKEKKEITVLLIIEIAYIYSALGSCSALGSWQFYNSREDSYAI